jgi:DNA-binding transcriptional LysR family regulator
VRRNLDLTALRALVTVVDAGSVTRAAAQLNLTQSAVSMQIKRLEESLDLCLLDRSSRQLSPTTKGEEVLGYARRMMALNDEAMERLTLAAETGEVVLGVPHDIVYPRIPQVLRHFAADFPKIQVRLISSFTRSLKEAFARAEADVVLTTETAPDPGAETLAHLPLRWVGAPGGLAWRQRPLRLAHETQCGFRVAAQARLDSAGIPWEMAIDTDSSRSSEATVSADLAVHTMLEGAIPAHFEIIDHAGSLPALAGMDIALYVRADATKGPVSSLARIIRDTFRA